MHSYFNILALGIWFIAAWPCFGKVYEIGLEAQRIDLDEVKYFVEPVTVPLDIEKFKDFDGWKLDKEPRSLRYNQVKDQRVLQYFEISSSFTLQIYFYYSWNAPLNFQKFIVIDSSGKVIETDVVNRNMLLSNAYLPAGQYKVLFIAEPKIFSSVNQRIAIMNPAHISSAFMRHSKFRMLIYGVGLAFIFFNFSMFLLHKRSYFIFYVVYSMTILFLLTVGNGEFSIGNSVLWNLSLILNCLFTVLLSSSVLRMKEFHPKILRTALIFWSLCSLFLISYFFTDRNFVLYIGMMFGIGSYILCIFVAVRRMQAGYIPATFFALGWGVLVIGYGLNMVAIYFVNIPDLYLSAYVAYALESMLFAVALAYRTRDSEQRAVQDKVHALAQLEKVVYPHQMQQIKQGLELEGTMPPTSGHACVISFDIIGSSKIKHIRSKEFFRNVFTRCNEIMAEGYDGKKLRANAYRIKEMGDGFLCSVGYPFAAMSINPANAAIDLAKRFARVLADEASILHSKTPIACGIGIALDSLTGFYPEAGTKEYDIFGQALVLATRYESMRKTLFQAEQGRSIIIIQNVVHDSLDPSHREGFIELDLKEMGIVVRDDPAATHLFYQFLGEQPAAMAKPDTHLKAV